MKFAGKVRGNIQSQRLLFQQNLFLSQLQEDRQRDLLYLDLSSMGQYPGPHALLYQVLVSYIAKNW